MTKQAACMSTLLVGILSVGCAGDSVSISQIEEQSVKTFCDILRNCPGAFEESAFIAKTFEAETSATCEELLVTAGLARTPDEVQGVNEGTISYDGGQAKRCLDAMERSCASLDAIGAIPECAGIFTGKLAIGATCRATSECEPNAYCANDNSCAGTCTARVALGAPCSSDDACAPIEGAAASCMITTANIIPHCVKLTIESERALGEPCGEVDSDGDEQVEAVCDRGLYCRYTSNDVGVCAEPIATGAPCDDGDACVEGFCSQAGICRVITLQKTPGAACDFEDAIVCDATQHLGCNGVTGVCEVVGDGGVGSPCTLDGDFLLPLFTCNDGLFCDQDAVSETCQPRKNLGAACNRDGDCLSSSCENDTCMGPTLCSP